MDKRHLEYILTLAEMGNITRAAKKLYISQPTLSQFLAKQEKELGAPLFQRTGGIYTLTPVGTLYAEYASKVLMMTNQLEQDIKRISNTTSIRIGTSSARAIQMCTSILLDFRKVYPNVELLMSEGSLHTISNKVNEGELDFAFTTLPSQDLYPKNSIKLKAEEVFLTIATENPHCQVLLENQIHSLTSAQIADIFKNSPFILQYKGSCIRYLVDEFFQKEHFTPVRACNTNNASSIRDMVANNIGIGFVPHGYAVSSPEITYFSLEPKQYRIHSVLYRKDLFMEDLHKYLLNLAVEYTDKNWKNLF